MEAGITNHNMEHPKADDVKARIRVCPGCDRQMNNVANAMRRHGSDMAHAIELAKTDVSEEERLAIN
jgi:DNA-directed RNA polymerase subunit L